MQVAVKMTNKVTDTFAKLIRLRYISCCFLKSTKEVFTVQGMMALAKTTTPYGPRSAFLYYNPTPIGEDHQEGTPYPSLGTR